MAKICAGLVFVFLLLSAGGSSWAHHPTGGAGTEQAGPIRTTTANTLEKGNWVFVVQSEFIDLKAFSDEQLLGFAQSGNDVHSVDSIYHAVFGIGYGITDDFTISVKGTYEKLKDIREAHAEEPDEVHIHGNSKGFGDTTILGQYRFINMKEKNFESSVLFGVRVPTGRTKVKDNNGERFETEFQTGTGSWDPIVSLAATKRFGQLSVDASLQYTFATEGAQDTDLGDVFDYNAALSYRVLRNAKVALDLVLEANGEWKQKQKVAGIKDENSGENVIFLSPGLRVVFQKQWSAYLSVSFPVVQDLNGIQNKTNTRTVVGISLAL